MAYINRQSVSITTATGGGGTGYSPPVTGNLLTIIHDATSGLASTADFTVTVERDHTQSLLR